jgi:hypothetical protein
MNSKVENLISEYVSCCEICEQTDYQNQPSVKKHNQSVNRMYEIIKAISLLGDNAISKLTELLNHPVASKWLAHHLIEQLNITNELKQRCINTIRQLAKDNSPEGLGEKMWLEERGFNL